MCKPDGLPRIFYSVAEAAIVLGLGRDRIYKHIKTKRLDVRYDEKRTLITCESVHRFADSLPRSRPEDEDSPKSE